MLRAVLGEQSPSVSGWGCAFPSRAGSVSAHLENKVIAARCQARLESLACEVVQEYPGNSKHEEQMSQAQGWHEQPPWSANPTVVPWWGGNRDTSGKPETGL